jgi:hypothetical protein
MEARHDLTSVVEQSINMSALRPASGARSLTCVRGAIDVLERLEAGKRRKVADLSTISAIDLHERLEAGQEREVADLGEGAIDQPERLEVGKAAQGR